MGKKNRKSGKSSLIESDAVANNPFGGLSSLGLPDAEVTPVAPEPKSTKDLLRFRIEKKGRGGKTVTVIEGFSEDPSAIATQVKQHLGTGGSCFEGIIELQGDCRAKAAEYFRKDGHKVKGA